MEVWTVPVFMEFSIGGVWGVESVKSLMGKVPVDVNSLCPLLLPFRIGFPHEMG